MTVVDLRARLEASRAALVAALQGLSERDFTADAGGGMTLLQLLGALAPAEREAVRRARSAAGAAARPTPGRVERERLLPPALIHDLAGARYETMLLLDEIDDGALDADADGDTVGALIDRVAEREEEAVSRIAPPSADQT